MNLHEIYETLLKRGMPEHPSIYTSDGDAFVYGGMMPAELDDTDARDLLTMHALHWALEFQRLHFVHSFNGWLQAHEVEHDEYASMEADAYDHGTDEILEAILAATAHL